MGICGREEGSAIPPPPKYKYVYIEAERNGSLRVVYPYLCDENTDDNVGALCDRLRSDGVGDSTVFITPSLNELLGGAKLDDQILFHGVAYSLKQIEDDGAGDVK